MGFHGGVVLGVWGCLAMVVDGCVVAVGYVKLGFWVRCVVVVGCCEGGFVIIWYHRR
jgi:hypothetical protein